MSSRRVTAASRSEQLRRRRMVRTWIFIGVIAVVILVAVVWGPAGDTGETASSNPPARPAPKAACGADAPQKAQPQQYSHPPRTTRTHVDYAATIHTSCGDIAMDLLEEKAPITVDNFVFLAKQGFFDGLIWHRVEKNAVLQSGDPNGRNGVPPDGPGYTIPDELPARPNEYVYGIVGMANAGPDTGGSQFFIVVHDPEGARAGNPEPAGYHPDYSIFGRVEMSSWDVLERIAAQPTTGGNDPVVAVEPKVPIYIDSIDITER